MRQCARRSSSVDIIVDLAAVQSVLALARANSLSPTWSRPESYLLGVNYRRARRRSTSAQIRPHPRVRWHPPR